jgi:hypothetical protein
MILLIRPGPTWWVSAVDTLRPTFSCWCVWWLQQLWCHEEAAAARPAAGLPDVHLNIPAACPIPLACSRLLLAGADVNAGDYDQRTALHVAAADGNLPAAKVLIEGGAASLDVRDRWGPPDTGAAASAERQVLCADTGCYICVCVRWRSLNWRGTTYVVVGAASAAPFGRMEAA